MSIISPRSELSTATKTKRVSWPITAATRSSPIRGIRRGTSGARFPPNRGKHASAELADVAPCCKHESSGLEAVAQTAGAGAKRSRLRRGCLSDLCCKPSIARRESPALLRCRGTRPRRLIPATRKGRLCGRSYSFPTLPDSPRLAMATRGWPALRAPDERFRPQACVSERGAGRSVSCSGRPAAGECLGDHALIRAGPALVPRRTIRFRPLCRPRMRPLRGRKFLARSGSRRFTIAYPGPTVSVLRCRARKVEHVGTEEHKAVVRRLPCRAPVALGHAGQGAATRVGERERARLDRARERDL